MKVLAIIPACEGSVTFPNKNMRVILGKPMIYYVINNALRSEFVTDIVVTTNSCEIISLAKQMKVMTQLRAPELCSSDVSLDAVVYNACQHAGIDGYDYIITMQSISPALRVETLDDAFRTIVRENYDTLISVKNKPRFCWIDSNGAPYPLQSERMNRHLLPPFYIETGAFLITKPQFITKTSRLGENVGLYELNDDEAIDVDSFGDLCQAENAMSRHTTAIYVNGNNEIGMGHISRALQIADELFTKPDIYYDVNRTSGSVFGSTSYNTVPVCGNDGFAEAVRKKNYDVIINDILSTDRNYMSHLRSAAGSSKIVNFEDDGDGAGLADTVINALFEHCDGKNINAGSKYFILPKLFLIYDPIKIHDHVNSVIVTFGGADPSGYTELLLEIAAEPEFAKLHFYFILGGAKRGAAEIKEHGAGENVTLMFNIDNMPEIMSKCDLAVTSRGRTCFELASIGVPTISIPQNDNEAKHTFVCAENGFDCLQLKPSKDTIREMLRKLVHASKEERLARQKLLLSHDLRGGRKNVAGLINGLLSANADRS